MEILLLGMGPVGLATAWDLLQRGHTLYAFDKDPNVVERLLAGEFSRVDSLGDGLRTYLGTKLKIATLPSQLPYFDNVVVCVGTPNAVDGSFDLSSVEEALSACMQSHLQSHPQSRRQHLILRSTFSPGTIEKNILPLIEKNTLFSYYPEFLREKFAKDDIINPPLAVAAHSCETAKNNFSLSFPNVNMHKEGNFSELETLKIASNAFHALKVSFVNEISQICRAVDADAEEVMRMFCQDKKLNLSALYLKPGAPFGGPCLDKDLIALESFLSDNFLNGETLRSIRRSNNLHKMVYHAHSFRPTHQERSLHNIAPDL